MTKIQEKFDEMMTQKHTRDTAHRLWSLTKKHREDLELSRQSTLNAIRKLEAKERDLGAKIDEARIEERAASRLFGSKCGAK